jgi:hypothetical protein
MVLSLALSIGKDNTKNLSGMTIAAQEGFSNGKNCWLASAADADNNELCQSKHGRQSRTAPNQSTRFTGGYHIHRASWGCAR